MGGRPDEDFLEETARKLERSLGAPRITEQPRRHGSAARYIHDPITQGYRSGGLWVMGHGAKEVASDPRTLPYCFSIYLLNDN